MMNTKCNHSKGDMKVEAKSSSSGSCGKFIEVVIMLILIGSYYCFIHGYYCSTTVNTARTKLMLLHRIIFSATLHGWYYMAFVTTVGKEYDKVFNHLDMLNAPLEGKGRIVGIKRLLDDLRVTTGKVCVAATKHKLVFTARVKFVLLKKIEENILSSYYSLYIVNAAGTKVTTAKRLRLLKEFLLSRNG
ncbi:hypothetical protein Tco_0067140 [Tanacetum coccineum]